MAGDLTDGCKCHAGMTLCEYVASARAEILERSKISVYAPRFSARSLSYRYDNRGGNC